MHWKYKKKKKKKKRYATEKEKAMNSMGFENSFISTEMLLCQESVANADERTTAKLYFVVVQKSYRGSLRGGRD